VPERQNVDHSTETKEPLRLDVPKYLARKIPLSPEQRYEAPELLMKPLTSESCLYHLAMNLENYVGKV
jgi:hypothetical protein